MAQSWIPGSAARPRNDGGEVLGSGRARDQAAPPTSALPAASGKSEPRSTPRTVHASCVLLDEIGILIRGASGAGKSRLARRLVAGARAQGRFARLVADDRVALACCSGRIVARPVAPLSGLVEVRGVGLLPTRAEAAALVRLVVDCLEVRPDRLPAAGERAADLLGVRLPRVAGLDLAELESILLDSERDFRDALMTRV
ncbi:MAG TPA: HPr kinase/phosphatase C-terminal domain-containing protein [Beijerinckiaceae bacterium]